MAADSMTTLTKAGQQLANALDRGHLIYFDSLSQRYEVNLREGRDATAEINAAAEILMPAGEGAGLREALGQIACLSPEPDNKTWTTEPWGDPANYQAYDDNGSPQEIVPDCDDKADREAFGYEQGLHRAAVIARAALGPPVYSSATLTPPADPKPTVPGNDAGMREGTYRIRPRPEAVIGLAMGLASQGDGALLEKIKGELAPQTGSAGEDLKTPDAGVAGLPPNWLADNLARADADLAQWSPGLRASFEATHGPLAQPAPAGEDETGVREGTKEKDADYDLVAEWLDWNRTRKGDVYVADSASIHCLRKLIEEQIEMSVSAALAPQPPKAETPAGVGDEDALCLSAAKMFIGWPTEFGARLGSVKTEAEAQAMARELADFLIRHRDLARAALSAAPAARPGDGVLEEIAAERRRQIEQEGWTPGHDDTHSAGEMAKAAAAYAMAGAKQTDFLRENFLGEWDHGKFSAVRSQWPSGWDWSWFKPTTPRRDLVKAGALIVAEIERLDRAVSAAAPAADGGRA